VTVSFILKEGGTTWVWIVTAVLAIIIITTIVIIVCRRNNVITRRQSGSQNGLSFDHSVIKISRDGFVHAVNPLAVSGNDHEYELSIIPLTLFSICELSIGTHVCPSPPIIAHPGQTCNCSIIIS
jgi:hypothetical protein